MKAPLCRLCRRLYYGFGWRCPHCHAPREEAA